MRGAKRGEGVLVDVGVRVYDVEEVAMWADLHVRWRRAGASLVAVAEEVTRLYGYSPKVCRVVGRWIRLQVRLYEAQG